MLGDFFPPFGHEVDLTLTQEWSFMDGARRCSCRAAAARLTDLSASRLLRAARDEYDDEDDDVEDASLHVCSGNGNNGPAPSRVSSSGSL